MNVRRPMLRPVYIVTDIECDGPRLGEHSMIAFASVAVTAEGEELGAFEAVLEPLPGASPDPQTLAWWQTQPEAWAAATTAARPPGEVMARFVDWVRGFDQGRIFTAFPLAFDGSWIDGYLRRFTGEQLVGGHYHTDPLFDSAGLCLRSFAAAVTGIPVWQCEPSSFPPDWLGHHEHTHRAIDDARGYGQLLGALMRRAADPRSAPSSLRPIAQAD